VTGKARRGRALFAAVLAAAMLASPAVLAHGSHAHHVRHAHHAHQAYRSHPGRSQHAASHAYRARAYPGVKRDAHGRIARSAQAKDAFRKMHPCPATGKRYGACPGYVIDHIQALKHGGADAPSNMQWQTRADAKAKDRWE
jgi:hypothetical protein